MEEDLAKALSEVLLDKNVEGLEEELIEYMAGMLSSKVLEDDGDGGDEDDDDIDCFQEAVDEVLVPFLESVNCPENLIQESTEAVLKVLHNIKSGTPTNDASTTTTTSATTSATTTRKLQQGVVSMASELTNQTDAEVEASRYLWGSDRGVKAMANDLIDAQKDKTSAKEKRKVRKADAEKMRKLLSKDGDRDIDEADEMTGGLVKMNFFSDFLTGDTGSADRKKDVQLRNVTVSLDNGTVLLEAGELKFAYQRRYGLIGENGVGKSTLLKAIANGIDGFPAHLRVLHVRQEVPAHLKLSMTVMQAVLESDVERTMLLKAEKDLLAKLDQAGKLDTVATTATDDNNSSSSNNNKTLTLQEKRKKLAEEANADDSSSWKAMAADLKKLDEVYARLQVLGSDSAEARAAMILSGLQFTPQMQTAPLSSLSGGWKMRVALAAALFIEPEICMLDEPTNHLYVKRSDKIDLEAVLWLETYLATYNHTLIVVSHDRGFLNEVCTDIIEFKKRKLTYYRGNFDNYVKQRDENIRNAMRLFQAYESKREHMMDFITRFRANAKRATMVQSRIKAVEKMDAEAPEAVVVDPVWRFSIPHSDPLGPPIIAVNDVSFDYTQTLPDGNPKPKNQYLLQDVNFGITLTSKIAILGANGQGKTTLLNLIMGKLKPTSGGVSINSGLRIGHFTQHSGDNFDLKLSAVENLLNMFEDAEDQEMRSFLGKFQIQGNDALKPMMLLSGGQKSRVAFAALAYKKPHVLVIDEGSNHLSMEAVDALVEAIQDFKGGLMVVSHDQYFVSNTCSELWVVHEGKAARFRGNFDEYKAHTAEVTQKRVEESVKRVNAVNS